MVRCDPHDGAPEVGAGIVTLTERSDGEGAREGLLHEVVGVDTGGTDGRREPPQRRVELHEQRAVGAFRRLVPRSLLATSTHTQG